MDEAEKVHQKTIDLRPGKSDGAGVLRGKGPDVFHRSTGVNDGHGLSGILGFIATFPLYFLTFFVSFFPWSTRVPAALRSWWSRRTVDLTGWYLLLQALVVFVVFSCVRTKLPHYTMPAFPCIALWLALQLRSDGTAFAWFEKRFVTMAAVVLVLVLGFAAVAKNHLLSENLWQAVQTQVRPETKVGCFGFAESSLVWKFRAVTTNYVVLDEVKKARNFLTNPPPFILVLPTKDLGTLPDTNGLQFRVRGFDMVKFKNWDLTAIVR